MRRVPHSSKGVTLRGRKVLFLADKYQGQYFGSDTAEMSFTVLAPAAINETNESIVVSIYPNPTTHHLTLTSGFPAQIISIYNLQGQVVQQMRYSPQIDVGMLSAGMYVLEVQGESDVVRRRFVKE